MLFCEFLNFFKSSVEKFKIGSGNQLKAIIFRASKLKVINTDNMENILYLSVSGCNQLKIINTSPLLSV